MRFNISRTCQCFCRERCELVDDNAGDTDRLSYLERFFEAGIGGLATAAVEVKDLLEHVEASLLRSAWFRLDMGGGI